MFPSKRTEYKESSNHTFSQVNNAVVLPQMEIGQPHDDYEKEANTMADHVLSGAEGKVMMMPAAGNDEDETLQMQSFTNNFPIQMIPDHRDEEDETLRMLPLSPHPALQMKCADCEEKVQMEPAEPGSQESQPDKSKTKPSRPGSHPFRQGKLGFGEIPVDLVYVDRREARHLFWKMGINLPGGPPDIKLGTDGPIPEKYHKNLQMAFDTVYYTEKGAIFAHEMKKLKENAAAIKEMKAINAATMLEALKSMRLHFADTSKQADVAKSVKEEAGMPLERQTAGYTVLGTNNVYLREFALNQGIESMSSLLLHESFHVAGLPQGPFAIYEPWMHEFEANVGFPIMMGGVDFAPLSPVTEGFTSAPITYTIRKIDEQDIAEDLAIEILNDNHDMVFKKSIGNAAGEYTFNWNGRDNSGNPVPWGLYTVRISSQGMSLLGSTLLEIQKKKAPPAETAPSP